MRITDDEILEFMHGKSRGSKERLAAAAVMHDPLAAQTAATVKADDFERSLKKTYLSRNRTPVMDDNREKPLPPGTELEPDEEVAQVQAELRKLAAQKENPKDITRPEQPFRPSIREPIPILIVCDDGQNTGEIIRIRSDRFVIGRSEGDFQLPADELVSSRHVAITRQSVGGVVRWVVTDLQSRNGLYVRVAKAPLTHKSEVLIGGGCYRLEIVQNSSPATAAFHDDCFPSPRTRAFDSNVPVGSVLFSEVLYSGAGARHLLSGDEYWIGSSRECHICRAEDPYVSARHAKLWRSSNGTWMIMHNATLNGIWLRMPQIVLETGKKCEFQIGEQRFRLRYGVSL